MQRTTIYAKNDKIYIQREFETGVDRWTPTTRLTTKSVAEVITRLPKTWIGRVDNDIHEIVGEE